MTGTAGEARRAIAVGLPVLAALALLGFAQTSAGANALEALGLAEPPERYTELAFIDAEGLPDYVTGTDTVEIAFEIHNHEGERRDYHWVLDAEGAGTVTNLASGSTALRDGAATEVRRSVTLRCSQGRLTLRARLLDPRELISAAMTCLPEGT